MKPVVFACMAQPGEAAHEALLLARSIRHFAGSMAGSLIWVLFPQDRVNFQPQVAAACQALDVRLMPFALSAALRDFPFAAKTVAAGRAEAAAAEASANLVWMDRPSLVLQEPLALRLPPGKVLAYRPVDHTLIGSRIADPLDDFWALVYRLCAVPAERVFPMITSVDEQKIRPYFNAGLLLVRPEQQLLRSWADNFARLVHHPSFAPFFEKDFLYRIFVHQALLAGTILARCAPGALQLLPPLINYPLHMHDSYPADQRPARMNDIISCRYETFFQDSAWPDKIRIDEPLYTWLKEQR